MAAAVASIFVNRHARIPSRGGSALTLRGGVLDLDPPLKDGLMLAIDARFERIANIAADGKDALIDDSVENVETFSATVHKTGSFQDREVLGNVCLTSSEL